MLLVLRGVLDGLIEITYTDTIQAKIVFVSKDTYVWDTFLDMFRLGYL